MPGQRLGARAWYWFLREYVSESMGLLFTGSKKFWTETFLPMMQRKFSVSFNVLDGVGSEVNFLMR